MTSNVYLRLDLLAVLPGTARATLLKSDFCRSAKLGMTRVASNPLVRLHSPQTDRGSSRSARSLRVVLLISVETRRFRASILLGCIDI